MARKKARRKTGKNTSKNLTLNAAIGIVGVLLLGFIYSFSQNTTQTGVPIEITFPKIDDQPRLAVDVFEKNPIKNIKVEGISGANSVKVTLNGDGEMIQVDISPETMKEEKSIIEDLIVAAHNNAKTQLKSKTSEEISKATGGLGIPGFKWPI